MAIAIIVLRLVHILSSIVWLGGTVVLVGYVLPTVRRTGPEGARFAQSLAAESGLPKLMTAMAILSTVAGLALFDFASGHFDPAWMGSSTGIAYSTGMLFGLLAFLHGLTTQNVFARRLGAIGRAVAAAGGPPSPEQARQMETLRGKMAVNGRVSVALLLIAAAAMSVARYV